MSEFEGYSPAVEGKKTDTTPTGRNERHESVAQPEQDLLQEFDLPTGFVTERGSLYTYGRDGSVHRDKFDGTEHDMGLAVFLSDEEYGRRLLRFVGAANNSELPPDKQRRVYVIQIDDSGARYKPIYKTDEVIDPESIAIALIDGNQRVTARTPVSIQPQMGSTVFEVDRYPDGSTTRHVGHRVTDIIV